MPTETWFPTFVFFEDLRLDEEVRGDALQAIKERIDLKKIDTQAAITASNSRNDFHHDPRIQRLLVELRPVMERCFFDELSVDRTKVRFTIGRCWPVIQINNGGSGTKHIHRASTFSAVLYLSVPDGAGNLEFYKSSDSIFDALPKSENTSLNFQTARYAAKENRILIFPSELQHRRYRNEGEGAGERLAIAFDIYSTSDLENYEAGRPHPEQHIAFDSLTP